MKNSKGGKLSLNKETIAKLNDDQMRNVNGGWTTIPSQVITLGGNCTTNCTVTQVCCDIKGFTETQCSGV